jgi:DNA-binding NarL/FixJ family response regulator
MIKLVFIDHHSEFRHRMCRALSFEKDFEVAGMGKDGYEAISLVQKCQPQVILLDLELPQFHGFEAAPILKHYVPAAEIIILTDAVSALYSAMNNQIYFKHISGYLTRTASFDLICQAIRTVRYGGRLMAPEIADRIGSFSLYDRGTADLFGKISPGERELIGCIGRGMSTRAMAKMFCRSEGTIRNQISTVLHKTGLHDRAQVAAYAIRLGL